MAQPITPQHTLPQAFEDDHWHFLRAFILRRRGSGRRNYYYYSWPPATNNAVTTGAEAPLPMQVEVAVTWRPPQRHLHYDALYRGIFEFLRAPPNNRYREAALRYLSIIRENINPQLRPDIAKLQAHRVQWTLAWFQALPDNSDDCSDAETVVSAELVG
jgi:hypothetical protein